MITSQEYAQRRKRVLEAIGKDGIAILMAAPECFRTGHVEYLYRQNSDFYYLSGFKEPEAILVLAPAYKEGEYLLFNRERDEKSEIWTGRRAGQQSARDHYGASNAFSIQCVDKKLPEILSQYQQVYYPFGQEKLAGRIAQWTKENPPAELIDLNKILHEMRLKKSAAEMELMRTAAYISANAQRRAMKTCRLGMMEYELEAELLYEFARHQAYPPAYNNIVAGGGNACVLHYVDNNAQLNANELVLVDAGGEYQYYASDITRTFPISGRFTPEQRAIYEIVLRAQKAVIEQIKPGVSFDQLQQTTVQLLTQGLLQLGLLSGDLETLLKEQAYKKFYMHNVSHWLGLDAHDVGAYRMNERWRILEPNMVLTVEPGIYIQPDEKIAKKWWNIGVRIEDDIAVTAEGHEILSKDAPKEIDEIENLMIGNRHPERSEGSFYK